MRLTLTLLFSLGLVLSLPAQDQHTTLSGKPLHFTKMQLSSESYESAGVMDVNNDGHPDIVSGAFWYEGPVFSQRHFLYEVNRVGEYWDDFSTIPLDVNGDGHIDVITGGWFEESLFWLENPGGQGNWTKHIIDHTGPIETTRSWDLDGDGVVEIIPNTPNHPLRYYRLVVDDQGKGTGKFQKVTLDTTAQGHGLGFGDINGDQRTDIILSHGWLAAPKNSSEKWAMHREFDFGDASVPILVVDVDEDGLKDLIVGQGHDYGLHWYRQHLDANGKRTWQKHIIDEHNSQYHTMEWVDLDGDGKAELVTGKRYRAHNGNDPGAGDPIGLYYFKWNGESFSKQIISYGSLGAGKGAGIFFSLADLRQTGRQDIIVAGKDGLYIFFNEGSK